jgi:hypothetical protein
MISAIGTKWFRSRSVRIEYYNTLVLASRSSTSINKPAYLPVLYTQLKQKKPNPEQSGGGKPRVQSSLSLNKRAKNWIAGLPGRAARLFYWFSSFPSSRGEFLRCRMLERHKNEVQLRSVLCVIFKRKNRIFIFFSVTVFTVVVATFLIEKLYEASSQILVTLGGGGLLFANMADQTRHM